MRIHRVRIENFLSFDHFDWSSQSAGVQVFVGPNGAGKTNLFRAIQAVQRALQRDTGPIWAKASHDPEREAFSIELEIEFTTLREHQAIAAFVAACFSHLEKPASEGDRGLWQAWARRLRSSTGNTDLSWLYRGHLTAAWDGQSWSTSFEAAGGVSPFIWVLDSATERSTLRSSKHDPSNARPFGEWLRSLPERDQQQFQTAPPDESKWLPPVPSLKEVMEAASGGLVMEAQTPPSGFHLETWQHLLRQLDMPLAQNRSWIDATHLFRTLLDEAIISTENVRAASTEVYPRSMLTQRVALTDGANLPLFLFQAKNASMRRPELDATFGLFRHLTGCEVDVDLSEVGATRPGESTGEVALTVLVCPPGGRPVPLEFAGAGVEEALFLSAAVAPSKGRVVLLDEPAVNLHPTVQSAFLSVIQSRTDMQFLVNSHSPMLVPLDLDRLARISLQDGASRIASITSERISPDVQQRIRERLGRSNDARSMLFARGVLLTEGETELGALPVWYEKLTTRSFEAEGIQVFSVGGQTAFGVFVQLLAGFGIPWAIVCDGQVIGAKGVPRVIQQIQSALTVEVPRRWPTSFDERKAACEAFGVFSVATSALGDGESFESLPVVAEHVEEARRRVGQRKPAVGALIAVERECPPEVSRMFEPIKRRLSIRA